MIINFQIDLLVSINDVVKKIEMEKSINYDEKIIKNRIDKTKEDLDKYKILKEDLIQDFKTNILSEEDYNRYLSQYEKSIINDEHILLNLKKELQSKSYKKEDKRRWIEYFIKYKNINRINRNVVIDLIDNICIYENGSINIVFKYNNEYNELVNFINHNNI